MAEPGRTPRWRSARRRSPGEGPRLPTLGAARPTAEQELLLAAALLGDVESAEAWRRWRLGNSSLDAVDPSAYRLLPLLYRRLLERSVTDPLLPRLKGVYRRTWYHNRLLRRDLPLAWRAVEGAGVETLVVGGTILGPTAYRDDGVRPTEAIEIAVRRGAMAAAGDALAAAGWTARARRGRAAGAAVGISLECPGRSAVELRQELFGPDRSPRTEELVWSGAREVELDGARLRTPAVADSLLLACLPVARPTPWPQVQWAADVLAIHRAAAAEIEWDRFLALATRSGATLLAGACLGHLDRHFGLPVPSSTVADLERLCAGARSVPELAAWRRWRGAGLLARAASLPRRRWARRRALPPRGSGG